MSRGSKFAMRAVAGIALLVVVLIGAVMLAGNTDTGRAWIEKLTFSASGGTVRLAGLGGSFPSSLTLGQLQLLDREGVWLSAEHITLSWSPLGLLDRHVLIDALQVSLLRVERAPVGDGKSSGKSSIPFIEVGHVNVDRVELGAPLVGNEVALSAAGRLRLRSLEDADADVALRRLDGDGEYTLRLAFDSKRMDASLSVHEPAGGPLENLLSLPGLGALSASATLTGKRDAEKVDIALAAGALEGRVQGHVDLTHRSADLDYSLHSPRMAPRPDLSWSRLALVGSFRGSLAAPTTQGRLDVDEFRVQSAVSAAQLTANLSGSDGRITVRGAVRGLEIPGSQPRLFAGAPLDLDATVQLNAASRPLVITLAHPLLSLHASIQTAADNAGQSTAVADLKLPDTAAFKAFTGQDVQGSATVTAHLTHRPADDALNADATLGITGGSAGWLALAGPRVSAQLAGVLSSDTVKIGTLRLTGRGATIAASGSAKRVGGTGGAAPQANALAKYVKELQVRWQSSLPDLSLVSPDIAGELNVSGRLDGATTALTADAEASARLSVRGSPAGTVSAQLRARGLPGSPSASLQAHGELDGAPLTLDASLERRGSGAFHVLVRQAGWKSAHMEGEATADAALTDGSGHLNLKIGQLGDLDRLLGMHLGGSAEAGIRFVPAQGHSQAELHVDATDVVAGTFSGNLHLQAAGVSDSVAVQMNADSSNFYGFAARLASAATLDLDSRTLQLTEASVDYRGQELRLMAPSRVNFAAGLTIDDLKLGAQDALLELKGEVTPVLDLRASLLQVKPSLINAFSPGLLAGGLIEGRARLQGTVANPSGRMRIDATGIRFADDAATGLPAVDLRMRAELAGDVAAVNATLDAGGSSKMTASGNVPFAVGGLLALKIGGKLDVALANPLLEARGMRATGTLTADATVTGTVAAPLVGGGINLAQGTLRDYARGVSLTDITSEITGAEGRLQIKSFTAAAAPGKIAMTGTVGILEPGLPLDLKLTANNAQPIASNIVTANVDADVRVTGTARQRLDVKGTVHVNRATIGIPNSLPPDVAVLDVRRRGRTAAAAAEQQLVVGIDLVIEAPREILVQGRGLDAEMGGTIKLSGTTDGLLASGGLDLQRGSFSLAGSKLTFDPGSKISFDGAGLRKKIDPTLDFTAHTTLGSTTATLTITGFADAPKFDFSSSPVLPQDQILAQLLFGENAAQLTAIQAAELGAALASLSGVGGGGPSVLTKLQKSLGLDRLSVGANTTTTATGATENSGAAVAAGRYISKRVYIEGKQSTTGNTQVQVDVDLTKHLKLQTRLGNGSAITQGTTPENDPGSSVGLSYQFEY